MLENKIDTDLIDLKTKLLGSLLFFTQTFFKIRTGRDFIISSPQGREPHAISICRGFTLVFDGKITKLRVNIPPRYSKTEILIHFAAWCLANYPDCNFIYVSYSHSLAAKQTSIIRDIISLPHFKRLFGVEVSGVTSAKDNFETTSGGSVYGVGAGGTITGRGAGIRGCNRFGGCFLMDDMHKPDEADSDVMRDGVINWYDNTAQSRMNNGDSTPQIMIGQVVHEADLSSTFTKERGWNSLIIPALDVVGNALDPSLHSKETLMRMRETMPYVFASQYQQDPQPAGGGIFKRDYFPLLDEDPNIVVSFITCDTAETDKSYNDATVFNFLGLYKIKQANVDTGLYGLHCINCLEIRVEPKDLESEFLSFYADCCRYKTKPVLAAIEKKSTGVTLYSTLKNMQGIEILDIARTKASGSKTSRFLEMQSFAATKRLSFTLGSLHANMCIDHLSKITANNTHAHDDIADTFYDGVKLALIDEIIQKRYINTSSNQSSSITKSMAMDFNRLQRMKRARDW